MAEPGATSRNLAGISQPDRGETIGRLGEFALANPNPVLRVGQDGTLLYANAASQVVLTEFRCRIGEKVPGLLGQLITDALGQGQPGEMDLEVDGRWFSFAVTRIQDADYLYLYGHDISRFKETEQQLVKLNDQAQHMALHDPLTGLPNRLLLGDRLQQAIARCARHQEKLAVVFLDLDNFKQINDTHGHGIGDQVLCAVAQRLQAALRKSDTVARWGGDEMILLLPEIHHAQDALLACQRLKSTVTNELATDPMTSLLTLSMGIAVYPDDAQLPEILLQLADRALYRAKSSSRNEVVLCSSLGLV